MRPRVETRGRDEEADGIVPASAAAELDRLDDQEHD
jgi:hypothetical protein